MNSVEKVNCVQILHALGKCSSGILLCVLELGSINQFIMFYVIQLEKLLRYILRFAVSYNNNK